MEEVGDIAERIEVLSMRLETFTRPGDRRDALESLLGYAYGDKLLVGTIAMEAIISILEDEDPDIISIGLEILTVICSEEGSHLGEQFSEIFLKSEERVGQILSLLDTTEANLGIHALHLIGKILQSHPKRVQKAIIHSKDSIEILLRSIDNPFFQKEVLGLFALLVSNNPEIRKILIYQNIMEKVHLLALESNSGPDVIFSSLFLLEKIIENFLFAQYYLFESGMAADILHFFLKSSSSKVSNIPIIEQSFKILLMLVDSGFFGFDYLTPLIEIKNKKVLSDTFLLVGNIIKRDNKNPKIEELGLPFFLFNSFSTSKKALEQKSSSLFALGSYLIGNPEGQKTIFSLLIQNSESWIWKSFIDKMKDIEIDREGIFYDFLLLGLILFYNKEVGRDFASFKVTDEYSGETFLLNSILHGLIETLQRSLYIPAIGLVYLLISCLFCHSDSAQILLEESGDILLIIECIEYGWQEEYLNGLLVYLLGILVSDSEHIRDLLIQRLGKPRVKCLFNILIYPPDHIRSLHHHLMALHIQIETSYASIRNLLLSPEDGVDGFLSSIRGKRENELEEENKALLRYFASEILEAED